MKEPTYLEVKASLWTKVFLYTMFLVPVGIFIWSLEIEEVQHGSPVFIAGFLLAFIGFVCLSLGLFRCRTIFKEDRIEHTDSWMRSTVRSYSEVLCAEAPYDGGVRIIFRDGTSMFVKAGIQNLPAVLGVLKKHALLEESSDPF